LNYTERVYNNWNAAWSAGGVAVWDATFNTSFDARDALNQFNTTYDKYAYNVSLNYTERVYNNWNAAWSAGGVAVWDATFNTSFDARDSDTTYSDLSEFNDNIFAGFNHTSTVFTLWNSTWDDGFTIWDATFNASVDDRDDDTITTIWDATFNTSFDARDALNQFNTTYDKYAYNVSRNWTAMTFTGFNSTWDNNWVNEFAYNHTSSVFTLWNSTWDDGVTIWDATFNASVDDRDDDTITTIWDATFNTSFDARDALNQFNTTYDKYAYNVSLNYTQIVYENWNTKWDDGVTIWDTTFNDSFDARDSDTITTIWDATFNTSFDVRDALNQFNTTYDDYAYNVSLNYTKRVYENWNTSWSSTYNSSYVAINTTANIQGLLNYTNPSYNNVNMTGNLTLAQKITFAFGEMIDNIIDGWIQITGNLNVTGSINTTGNITLNDTLCFNQACSAKIYYNGSGMIITS
jgi:hypothetical protein